MRLLLILLLSSCASFPDEVAEINEMWAYAYQHREYDREDSRDVRYVDSVAAECAKRGVVAHRYTVRGCTVFGRKNYSILPTDATAMELGHEAAHRRYGDWHHGFEYFTQREFIFMQEQRKKQ